jgi:dTDP-glucose pyrophosphorylase
MTNPEVQLSPSSIMVELGDPTVLIPAAGPIQEGIVALSTLATPAMIPVAGLPVIHWSLRYLIGCGATKFRVAVPRRFLSIEDQVECVFDADATFDWIVPSSDLGAGGTVIELLEGVTGPGLIVLGDTLFEFGQTPPTSSPWLLTGKVKDSARWCIVETDDAGAVTTWRNKEMVRAEEHSAAVGVYYLPDCALAYQRAAHLAAVGTRVELSQVIVAAAGDAPIFSVAAGTWRDCGNPDTQEASRRQLLQQRSFNSMVLDDRFGTVRKSSTHRSKLVNEINFVQELPGKLSALFPAVVESSNDPSDPWIELDYCAYPTLTELFLYEHVAPAVWARVFDRINLILELFAEHPHPVTVEELLLMYIDKTIERLDACRSVPHLQSLISADSLEINGISRPNLANLLDAARHRVQEQATGAVGAVMHGDLCFSNILYDVRTGACKLIDPRGSFGSAGVYGDQRYDVAKIHHSVIGGYDHFGAGLFRLKVTGATVTLDVHMNPAQQEIQNIYERNMLSNWNTQEIELITGLMFAGLPALHTESADRQIAFYVRAVEMVSAALGGESWR